MEKITIFDVENQNLKRREVAALEKIVALLEKMVNKEEKQGGKK
jgi:hypothetical protein